MSADTTNLTRSQQAAALALGECWATHPETPGPNPECCIPAAVSAFAGAARPVHYREAGDSLRKIAAARLAASPDAIAYARAEGINEAAGLLDSTARDMEDTTDE